MSKAICLVNSITRTQNKLILLFIRHSYCSILLWYKLYPETNENVIIEAYSIQGLALHG